MNLSLTKKYIYISLQSTNTILLIKPSGFGFNTETAESNAFQNKAEGELKDIQSKVNKEFDAFAQKLRDKGIHVLVFEDTELPRKPDAIFPNNWISFHPNGTIVLYPMAAPNRRHERRPDIIESLKNNFEVKKVIDLSHYENQNKFLEGTGSVVFDHDHKFAYASLSPRTHKDLFLEVCSLLDYKPVYFHSHDKKGKEIYHTNVMMCIGKSFVVVCLDSITDPEDQEKVIGSFALTGHKVIDITFDQMTKFAGNMLAVQKKNGQDILVMSQSAFDSLRNDQKKELEKLSELLPLSIPTIETIGGGSARCMMAEVFLPNLQA